MAPWPDSPTRRVLVAGWFSFEGMGATVGDLLARDVVIDWMAGGGIAVDVALAKPFGDGPDWRALPPEHYSAVVFVCGPFGNGPPLTGFLERFGARRLIGIDLTMLESPSIWNPFELLLERDSDRAARPDLAFAAPHRTIPLVGVFQVHRQREYGARGRYAEVGEAIERLFDRYALARLDLDTRLDIPNPVGRTPEAIESVVRRMDVIVTSRLHGLVLALRHGVPALALDPIDGGAKLSRQASAIGWTALLRPDELSDEAVDRAFSYCLSAEARAAAQLAATRAADSLDDVRNGLLSTLAGGIGTNGGT
jgi:hypothetical protein